MVQSTILSSGNSAWANRDFIRQTIDRLKTLTGESAIGWKTAYAQWLLSWQSRAKKRHRCGGAAHDRHQRKPRRISAARTCWRRRMTGSSDTSPSLEEWRKASELEPQAPQAQFAYLQALHKAGKKEDEQVVFDRLAGMNNVPPDMALAAATILAADGDMQRAENMLVAYPNATNRVLHDATLAKVYRVENRPSDAAAIYFNLETLPKLWI